METLGPILLIAFLVIMGIAYFVMCHAISVIARKTDHSETAEILAYIPILQIAPVVWVGGGSVRRALVFGIALLLANILLVGAATKVEGPLAIGLSIFGTASLALASVGYTTLLAWRTAVARELPGWFSLLTWLPGISVFVYPIMAFHDGWGASASDWGCDWRGARTGLRCPTDPFRSQYGSGCLLRRLRGMGGE